MTTAHRPVDIEKLRIEPLNDIGAFRGFDSGENEIDRNIARCCEWHGKYRNRIFCAYLPDEEPAVGFYCLGISAAESKYLDEKILRDSDGRAYVPFIYLNYLAVRSDYQRNGIGTILLINALLRCSHTIKNIGVFGVALNALNERVVTLYERYGFRLYGGRKKCPFMVLPAQAVLDLFP